MNNNRPAEETAIVKREIFSNSRGLALRNLNDMYRFAQYVVSAQTAPSCYKNNPAAVMIGIEYGAEFGIGPVQSLKSVAVINGVPSFHGDFPLGKVRQSGQLESIKEYWEGEGDNRKAICITKNKSMPEELRTEFSIKDARRAGLLDKDNWKKYTDRMLKMRARAWNLRDNFTDILMGMSIAEEVQDYNIENYNTPDMPQVPKRIEREQEQIPAVIEQEGARTLEDWRNELAEIFEKEFQAIVGDCEDKVWMDALLDTMAYRFGGKLEDYADSEKSWSIERCQEIINLLVNDNGIPEVIFEIHAKEEYEQYKSRLEAQNVEKGDFPF